MTALFQSSIVNRLLHSNITHTSTIALIPTRAASEFDTLHKSLSLPLTLTAHVPRALILDVLLRHSDLPPRFCFLRIASSLGLSIHHHVGSQ
jgi:hypothetical protein